jgi:hypothetical protein
MAVKKSAKANNGIVKKITILGMSTRTTATGRYRYLISLENEESSEWFATTRGQYLTKINGELGITSKDNLAIGESYNLNDDADLFEQMANEEIIKVNDKIAANTANIFKAQMAKALLALG